MDVSGHTVQSVCVEGGGVYLTVTHGFQVKVRVNNDEYLDTRKQI